MEILKKIGLTLGGIVVVLLLIALFLPREFMYEKSIMIEAPNLF